MSRTAKIKIAIFLLFWVAVSCGGCRSGDGGGVGDGEGVGDRGGVDRQEAPILIIYSEANPFSRYYAEILRTEGFNAFAMLDISSVTLSMLDDFDVVILGEMPLTTSQVTMLNDWVTAGGNLIAMRPDKQLADTLGLVDQALTLSDAYLLVNTSQGTGGGIINQTLQFHGAADLYVLNGASSLATLYFDSYIATENPAVTMNSIGTNGGQAAAFTYDLARSVIYTRQGNPAWASQERDGYRPVRSNDLFFGAADFDPQPDWVDMDKVAIPQADEQQRLLANMIIRMNVDRKPLPRFWYFPRSLPAVVVMTGDDHGNNGTEGRFAHYKSLSSPDCSIENWECIRSTSYIYPNTPLSNTQAFAYESEGFEVALHVNTNCSDWTPSLLDAYFNNQLSDWSGKYFSLSPPVTNRTHCIVWSDYVTAPMVELNYGIRLDTTYYYWPPQWVADRSGFFTGSGIPMRFAAADGTLIDVYQAPTQLTDESGQDYPFTIDTLLDRAIGPEGFYGAFVANIHTDVVYSLESDAIIESATARGIPVISARQMLEWLDGRNTSSFDYIAWSGDSLDFSVSAAQGARGLVAMVPLPDGANISGIWQDGSPIPFDQITVKGIRYARFLTPGGTYRVEYTLNMTSSAGLTISTGAGSTELGTATRNNYSQTVFMLSSGQEMRVWP